MANFKKSPLPGRRSGLFLHFSETSKEVGEEVLKNAQQMANIRKPPAPLERAIVKSILGYLNKQPGWKAKKIHGNAYSAAWPDILAIHQGQAYFLEVKRPEPYGTPVTPRQQAELEAWEAVGAVTAVVRSVDEVKEIIKNGNATDGRGSEESSGGVGMRKASSKGSMTSARCSPSIICPRSVTLIDTLLKME